jgi:hypothetical protein
MLNTILNLFNKLVSKSSNCICNKWGSKHNNKGYRSIGNKLRGGRILIEKPGYGSYE